MGWGNISYPGVARVLRCGIWFLGARFEVPVKEMWDHQKEVTVPCLNPELGSWMDILRFMIW